MTMGRLWSIQIEGQRRDWGQQGGGQVDATECAYLASLMVRWPVFCSVMCNDD